MEVDGLKNVWSLKGHNDSYDKYIVQSYVTETRILMIENDEIGEVILLLFLKFIIYFTKI